MKFFAGILALTILFLTVQPVFASAITTEEETACSSECCKTEKHAEDEENHSGCSDFCNPLLKCGSGATGKMDFIQFVINSPFEILSKPIATSKNFFSQFSPDFWQPPRLT